MHTHGARRMPLRQLLHDISSLPLLIILLAGATSGLLSLLSLGLFIHFIHSVSDSLHVNTLLRSSFDHTLARIEAQRAAYANRILSSDKVPAVPPAAATVLYRAPTPATCTGSITIAWQAWPSSGAGPVSGYGRTDCRSTTRQAGYGRRSQSIRFTPERLVPRNVSR